MIARPRCSSGNQFDNETTDQQSGCRMLLATATTATNRLPCWTRSENSSGAGTVLTRHISARLLQFSSSMSPAVDSPATTSTCPENVTRLMFNLGTHEHVTPCRIQLYWLLVPFTMTYKLCVLMHNILAGKSHDVVHSCSLQCHPEMDVGPDFLIQPNPTAIIGTHNCVFKLRPEY